MTDSVEKILGGRPLPPSQWYLLQLFKILLVDPAALGKKITSVISDLVVRLLVLGIFGLGHFCERVQRQDVRSIGESTQHHAWASYQPGSEYSSSESRTNSL
jgi:hypothetical protein